MNKLEKYLKHDKLNYKKTKSKIESQKRVLEMVRAIGPSVGYGMACERVYPSEYIQVYSET